MTDKDPPDKEVTLFGEAMTKALDALPYDEKFLNARDAMMNTVWERFEGYVIEAIPEHIEMRIRDAVYRTVEAMLEGDVDAVRRHLGCNGWTGRETDVVVAEGRLVDFNPMKMRRLLVEAHRDLITNERMLDLEATVESMTRLLEIRATTITNLEARLTAVGCKW